MRAVYGRGPRENLAASVPAEIMRDFNASVGAENIGSGRYRSAIVALALELFLAVVKGREISNVADRLATLMRSAFPLSIAEQLERLAEIIKTKEDEVKKP